MSELLFSIPLLLALVALILGVLRSIFGAWLNHRARLEVLRRLEKNPDLVRSPEEVQDLYKALGATPDGADALDYTMTGMLLCVLGAACIVTGRYLRVGAVAAGTYWGGMVCVLLGLLLAVLGLVIQVLSRAFERQSSRRKPV